MEGDDPSVKGYEASGTVTMVTADDDPSVKGYETASTVVEFSTEYSFAVTCPLVQSRTDAR